MPTDDRRRPVLLVERDPAIAGALARGLGAFGFDARIITDGPTAVAAFGVDPADLALIELELPGPELDGLGVCRELKRLAADAGAFLPVIFLTGSSSVKTRIAALEQGGDDFCAKPCDPDELAVRMRVLLRFRERETLLRKESSRFRAFALADSLTGLGNRRAFEDALDRHLVAGRRVCSTLALLVADIDHFKAVNDRYGHAVGDQVLAGVGRELAASIRQRDAAFRIGGEEFAVLLPDTGLEGALQVADRVRRRIAGVKIGPLSVTISLGISLTWGGETTRADLIDGGDRALYDAKAAGRDRVVVACRDLVAPEETQTIRARVEEDASATAGGAS